jgi:ABC-type multidrug transport system fused ATPase/permease subunit
MDVWRTFGAGERVRRALDGLGEQAARAASRAEASRAALSSANEVLGAIALLCCVWVGRKLSLPLGDGTLIAFAALFFMSYRPLRDLGDARATLERGELALASLVELAPGMVPIGDASPAARGSASPDGPGVGRAGRRAAALILHRAAGGSSPSWGRRGRAGDALRALLGLELAVGVFATARRSTRRASD